MEQLIRRQCLLLLLLLVFFLSAILGRVRGVDVAADHGLQGIGTFALIEYQCTGSLHLSPSRSASSSMSSFVALIL